MSLAAVVLFAVFVATLALGVPIAFAMVLAAVSALLLSVDGGPALATAAQRVATGLDRFALLAIPLFVFSGQIMARGGAARRLVDLGMAAVGRLRGGLALVTGLANLLFGAISGSAVASAAAVGGFMNPEMEKAGYRRGFAAAVNLTTATTGLLVPPSNVLIVFATAAGGLSVAQLFLAGYLPGILCGLLLLGVAAALSGRYGGASGARHDLPRLLPALRRAVPSLALIVVVMGGILGGIFTATEAGAVAVLYAVVLTTLVHRELSFGELLVAARDSARTSGVVLLLIAGSSVLSWVLSLLDIPQDLAGALIGLADRPLLLLVLMNLVLLVVGTVMDMTPAVLIFTPIFLPAALAMGIDPIHFGIVMVLNLCVGLCTPPVGTVLFVGLSTAKASLREVMVPLLPFYAAMVLALVLVTAVPEISLALPRWFGTR